MPAVRGSSVRSGAAPLLLVVVSGVLALLATACGTSAVDSGAPDATTAESVVSRGTAPRPSGAAVGTVPGSTPGSSVLAAPDPTAPTVTATPSSVGGSPTTGPASAPTTPVPASTAPVPAGASVVTATVRLVDTSRPTVSRGRQVAGTRTLTTLVAYPSSGGPYPLVVFAHGFHLGPSHYQHLISTIAAAGYVVAAPSFPLADDAVGGGDVDRGDIPNQAGDLSFVISQVAAGAAALPAGRVDATRVGAVGHSDGADTVLDLGYTPGRMDGRVRAVVALSPDPMTGAGGSVGSAPLLLGHGRNDTIVPYSASTTVFGQVDAKRWFVTLLGADHLPPAQGVAPWGPVVDRLTVDLLDLHVAGRTADDSALVAHASVAGVASLQQAG